MSEIKHGHIVPLIGGTVYGAIEAIKKDPEWFVSYPDFYGNERWLYDNKPDVKRYLITDDVKPGHVDIVTSVCPCAGLSMLNTSRDESKAGGNAAANNYLYETSDYILKNVKPKVLMCENAPALYASERGDIVRDRLIQIAMDNQYSISFIKTDTTLHDNPQKRTRTFVFFWNTPTAPIMNYSNVETPTLKEFLERYPNDTKEMFWFSEDGETNDLIYNPGLKFITEYENTTFEEFFSRFDDMDKVYTINQYLKEQNLLQEYIAWLENLDEEYCKVELNSTPKKMKAAADTIRRHLSKYDVGKSIFDVSVIISRKYVPAVINKNISRLVHPTEMRYLTGEEQMRLMGLDPNTFKFDVKKFLNVDKTTKRQGLGVGMPMRAITQNVPVFTAKYWIEECVKFCKNELPLSQEKVLFQNNMKQCIETPVDLSILTKTEPLF